MRLSAIFAVSVGVLMLAQWGFFLAAGQVPELQTEPWRIAMHLAAEFVTAAGLIASGIGLIRGSRWAAKAYVFFAGMLVYSVIASPGYFAQQGQWLLVLMFLALLTMTVGSLRPISREIKT
jgi:hypothetical protein